MRNKSNIFLKSTFILIVSGFLTKLFGFIIKVVYTRVIGEEGMALYAIATPSYSLMLTIATLAIPTSIAKLIAQKKDNERSIGILVSSAMIIITVNLAIIGLVMLTSKFLANNLLNEPRAQKILIAMALTLPFVSISSVFKGYFYGKQNMVPHALSNIIEQIIRLIIIYNVLPILVKKGVMVAVIGFILLTIVSEICSIMVFLFFLPKKINIRSSELRPSRAISKDILGISIPTVSSRIIGNIGYFFEPIILTNLLLFSGYSNEFILSEYGAFNAYAIALLTMPSFFISAISMALLPEISKFWAVKNMKMVKKRVYQGIGIALVLGLFFSFVIFTFRDALLYFLYNTTAGSDYIKYMAPFFVLFYLEGILISTLQAMDKAHISMRITLMGVVIKLVFLAILSVMKIGLYGLLIAEVINIFFVVIANYLVLKKELVGV